MLQADISWRWLVKNTCLPQRPAAVTLITSEFSKLKEKQRILSCHAVLRNSCDQRFAWQDRMWNVYTCLYRELVPVNSKKNPCFLQFIGLEMYKNKHDRTFDIRLSASGTWSGRVTWRPLAFNFVAERRNLLWLNCFCVTKIVFHVCKCVHYRFSCKRHNCCPFKLISSRSNPIFFYLQVEFYRAMVGVDGYVCQREREANQRGAAEKKVNSKPVTSRMKWKEMRMIHLLHLVWNEKKGVC